MAHRVATQSPMDGRPPRYKTPDEFCPRTTALSSTFAPPQSTSPPTFAPTTYIAKMSSSGFPEFDINDLNAFHNNNPYGNHPIFDEFDWNLLNDAGTSQPYTGADFQGDLNNYPAFLTPTTAPTSLHPNHEMSFNEGKSSHILTPVIRKLTFWPQDTAHHFTRGRPYHPYCHNRQPLPPPCPSTAIPPPLHPF